MKDEKRKKINLKKTGIRLGAVLILGISLYFLSAILSFKSPHGINQLEGIYWQPKNSIDVVMMGTSHVHCGINTDLLWKEYGIAAYDYSGAEQPLWMTYYYLRELLKYQSPRMIVLDLYAPARYKEDYQYEWIGENIYGMRFSLNKLEMLLVSVEPGKLGQYFPSFMIYHSRYDDLDDEDFEKFFWNKEEKESFKGYTPYWNREYQERPDEMKLAEADPGGLSLKSEKYLRKIIALAEKKECKLLLTVIPYVETEADRQTYLEIEKIAQEEGIPFINYNEYYDEMGLDFSEDFNDASHLNFWGSCKFTDFLGDFLSKEAEIPDRRNEEGYTSWERQNLDIS